MHVHVFAIDILPSNNLICSGGGLRSWQFINGLRQLGAEVTYSLPSGATLVQQQWDQLTPHERESCYGHEKGRQLIDLINKFKPDVALVLWPLAFWSTGRLKRGMLTVFDINGFQNVESTLFMHADFGKETQKYLQKISCADILITGSPEQRAYWGGLLGYHRNSLSATEMIDVPFSLDPGLLELACTKTYNSSGPLFFCTGTFLPWNSPQGQLSSIAKIISEAGRGNLLVVGQPIPRQDYTEGVLNELEIVSRFPFARIETGMPFSKMVDTIVRRGIAIDLHLPTFEREFALPVRTVTYLTLGIPVIFNNYSTLADQVDRYGAGFCIDPAHPGSFEKLIKELLAHQDDTLLGQMSDAAIRLVRENYNNQRGMKRLFDRMEQEIANTRGRLRPPTTAHSQPRNEGLLSPFVCKNQLPRVLVISDDAENMQEVRVHLPFRAMRQAQLIEDYIVMSQGHLTKRRGSNGAFRDIDVVWVQRRPDSSPLLAPALFGERFVLDLDDNLLISPGYRPAFKPEWIALVLTLLRCAGTVTTPGPRLVEAIQRHTGIVFEDKVVIAPNMTEYVHSKHITCVQGLLLSCSDHLPLTNSKDAFISAVQRFTKLRELPLIYLGTPINDFTGIAKEVRASSTLPYQSYLKFLRNEQVMGVVPLEAFGDPTTDDFVCSKSDIKMVEFGAASVPAVYSRVAPYSDSPLSVGPLVDFTDVSSAVEALDMIFNDADRQARQACESVRDQRLASLVAPQWYEAIERERLSHPVSLDWIQTYAQRYGHYTGGITPTPAQFDEANYAAAYPDAVDWVKATGHRLYDHYLHFGQKEGRHWHVADPGVSIEQTAAAARELVLTLDRDLTLLSDRVTAAVRG